MTFVRDPETRRVIDRESGEELQLNREHYQDLRTFQTIVRPDGSKRFETKILVDADGELANPAIPGDHVLVSATEYDSSGHATPVFGPHPDLERILQFLRTASGRGKQFTLTDTRRP